MDKLFSWLRERHHAISLLCFALGALLLLLGVTTGIELPVLLQLAPDANSRFVSLGLGGFFILLALLVYFVPPTRATQNLVTQVDREPLPKDDAAWQIFRYGTGPRKLKVRVPFHTPYVEKPSVVVALCKIDLQDESAHIHRIEVGPDDIETHGFTLYFATGHESIVYDAVACWVAIGKVV